MWCEIIIPTYQNRTELIACLACLAAQDCGPQAFRVWVCIDGSTDGTREWLAAHQESLPFALQGLQHPDGRNHGRNATRNLPLPYLELPYTLLLDSDMRPAPGLLTAHQTLLNKEPCISQGHTRFTQRRSNAWAAYLSTRGRFRYPPGAELPIQYTVTDNMALPTAWYVGIGGQDPAMSRHYGGDDTELGWRLQQTYAAPLLNNPAAWGENDMAKPLQQVMQQHREFGQYNLPYIRHKHPEFTSLFKAELLDSPQLKARLFRAACHPLLWALAKPLAYLPWPWLRRKTVRYGMVCAILQGYRRRQR
ncbi:MAG: glycosyltransferase [Bacteroidetes bacterium]|nr:glycosyltransferase [Bacteroidota bacterium]